MAASRPAAGEEEEEEAATPLPPFPPPSLKEVFRNNVLTFSRPKPPPPPLTPSSPSSRPPSPLLRLSGEFGREAEVFILFIFLLPVRGDEAMMPFIVDVNFVDANDADPAVVPELVFE